MKLPSKRRKSGRNCDVFYRRAIGLRIRPQNPFGSASRTKSPESQDTWPTMLSRKTVLLLALVAGKSVDCIILPVFFTKWRPLSSGNDHLACARTLFDVHVASDLNSFSRTHRGFPSPSPCVFTHDYHIMRGIVDDYPSNLPSGTRNRRRTARWKCLPARYSSAVPARCCAHVFMQLLSPPCSRRTTMRAPLAAQ